MTKNNSKKNQEIPKSLNVSNIGEESESNNSPKVLRHTEFVELKIPTNLFKLNQSKIESTQYHSISDFRSKQRQNIKNPLLHKLWGQLLHKFGILKNKMRNYGLVENLSNKDEGYSNKNIQSDESLHKEYKEFYKMINFPQLLYMIYKS